MALIPFDDRDGLIWMNGEMMQWRDARTHSLTHALHYASRVFEGERAYGGKIFKSRKHTERLRASCQYLDFDLPVTDEEMDAIKVNVLKANDISNGYVRAFCWRGSEMMAISAQHTKIHVAVAAWQWPSYFDPETKMKGIALSNGAKGERILVKNISSNKTVEGFVKSEKKKTIFSKIN